MIESDLGVGASARQGDERVDGLLQAATQELPPSLLHGRPAAQRAGVLLERLMAMAGACSGTVLVAGEGGRLSTICTLGLEDAALAALPDLLSAVPLGLTVHEPELNDQPSSPTDLARMVLWLPLEVGDRPVGAIRLAYPEFVSLETATLQRLGLVADHIALTVVTDRTSRGNGAEPGQRADGRLDRQDLDRLKGEFLAMISHELRTPLTAIIGYTDLLLRQIHGPLNDRQHRHQEAVKKAAHRLLALINDLLDVNRLESGHIVLQQEALSLTDAVRRACSQIEQAAEQRGVAVRLDVPAMHVSVLADHERLHQVLINLLDNAVKFTPPSGRVTVRVDCQDDTATVAVVDTGVGVASEQLERIWDRFHQADSSVRRHFGGTGLGLAIVRHLVELHGGSVSVSSDGVGKGSVFSFTLPIVDGAIRQRGGTARTRAANRPAEHPRTVLIVDDELDNREVIRALVQDALGHHALVAADGREALARVHPGIDLILLDLRMPGMSGFDVVQELKSHDATAGIPVLAITAVDDDVKLEAARAAGCVGALTKPFSHEQLSAAIASVFASEPGAAH